MNKTFLRLVMLTATVLTLSSCLDDNDDTTYTYYGDTAITAFTLGTVNRYVTKKVAASDGTLTKDTVISSTVTGSTYKFVIDQTTAQIYNTDSLPYGCKTSSVLATISTKNSGYVYIKSMTSDSLTYYSSSDSIDFSQPRVVRVYANDTQRYRDYTVTVNVHQERDSVMTWTQMASAPVDTLTCKGLKSVAKGDSLFLLSSTGTMTSISLFKDNAWTTLTPNLSSPLSADAYKSAMVWGGYLYVASNGAVLRSANGTAWTTVAASAGIKQLVAASTTEIYGLTDSGLAVSKDGGATWTAETLDSDASLLPDGNIAYTCQTVKTNNNMERVMLVGTLTGAGYAQAWTKLVDYGTTPLATQWSYVDAAGDTKYALAAFSNLAVMDYGDKAIAFGYADGDFTSVYQSTDNGITWKTTTSYTLPTMSKDKQVTATTDSQNYIWIVGDNGTVWRGRLSNLGWE